MEFESPFFTVNVGIVLDTPTGGVVSPLHGPFDKDRLGFRSQRGTSQV